MAKHPSNCADVPCRDFYKRRGSHFDGDGGGGRCYCNEKAKSQNLAASMNNHYWQYKSKSCSGRKFTKERSP